MDVKIICVHVTNIDLAERQINDLLMMVGNCMENHTWPRRMETRVLFTSRP